MITKDTSIRKSWKNGRTKFMRLPEAVAQRSSVKKVFLKISQNSPENTCTRVLQNTSGGCFWFTRKLMSTNPALVTWVYDDTTKLQNCKSHIYWTETNVEKIHWFCIRGKILTHIQEVWHAPIDWLRVIMKVGSKVF